MKDSRLWQMRLRGERDGKLSHPAFRLLSRLISDRVNSRDGADDEFPLPWSLAAVWLRLKEDQSYVYLAELVRCGYLFNAGLRGCPAKTHYKLVFKAADSSSGENPVTGSRLDPGTGSRKKAGTSSGTKPGRHISKSFGQGRVLGALRAREGGGKESTSLRSQKEGRKTVHAVAPAVADAALARARLARDFGETARKALHAG